IEELPPADFRAVDVRGEEDPHAAPRPRRAGCNICAPCATCSTPPKPASSMPDSSVRDFFWQFVPAHAVADIRPDPPLDSLGGRLGDLQELPGGSDRVEWRLWGSQAGTSLKQGRQLGQVAGYRPPPAPVPAEQLAEVLGINRSRCTPAHRHGGQEMDDVPGVLLVQLHDL